MAPNPQSALRCTRLAPASVVCSCRRERRSSRRSAVCTFAPRGRSARRACCRRPGLRVVDDGLNQAFTSAATSIRWPSKPTRSRRERRGGRWRIRSRTRLAKGSRPPILFLTRLHDGHATRIPRARCSNPSGDCRGAKSRHWWQRWLVGGDRPPSSRPPSPA
jgi:hypothetical protein